MIAKVVPRRSGTSSAARLVHYMVAAKGGKEQPSSWQRTADYILDTRGETGRGEKVSSFRVTNCQTDDPADAAEIIMATQARNTRSKAEKTYHLVYSFPPGEQPDLETLHAIEDELCEAIGYGDHQRISAVHQDTDHLHVHVAINKVHPETLRNVSTLQDQPRLMAACERLEIEYGLTRTNHGLESDEPEKARANARVQAAEAHRGEATLLGQLQRDIVPVLREAVSWQGVHDVLAGHGLEIRKRGNGLVIGSDEAGIWCRASSAGRDLSKGRLEARLGAFEPGRGQGRQDAQEGQRWQRRPLHQHPRTGALWQRYQSERQQVLSERQRLHQGIRGDLARRRADVQRKSALARAGLRSLRVRGVSKKLLRARQRQDTRTAYQNIRVHGQQRRAAVAQVVPLLSWQDWLRVQGERGDMTALAVLRSREKQQADMRRNLLTSEQADKARQRLFQHLKPHVRRDGAVAYRTGDGGLVLDRGENIEAAQTTTGAAMVALEIASQRFDGRALRINGSTEFRQEVAELAAVHGLGVRFEDEGLEGHRQQRSREIEDKREAAHKHAVQGWIEGRNQTRAAGADMLPHRQWTERDSGEAVYRGTRSMPDGSKALLLERGNEMLVRPAETALLQQAEGWTVGTKVAVGKVQRRTRGREDGYEIDL